MPVVVEALPELVWFAVLFFCFAFVWATRKLLAAMFKPVFAIIPSLPFVGSALDDFLHKIEQGVDGALGSVEHDIDALMGASFHKIAQLNEWLWSEFKRHTTLGILLAHGYTELTHAYEYLRGLAHHAIAAVETFPRQIRQLERELNGIEHGVRDFEKRIYRGIDSTVRGDIKPLRRDLALLEHTTIRDIRQAEADAEAAISNLYAWAKGKASLIGVGTFSLAVATALTTLGLDWIKCNSAKSFFRRAGCGFWSLLEDALAILSTLALGLWSVLRPQDLAEAAVAAVDEIEPILAEILRN